MPSLNKPVQRLKVATLPLDLPCSGPITHSEEISTTGKSHRKKIVIDNKIIEQVNSFNYLGNMISYEKELDIDNKLRNYLKLQVL